MLGGKRNSTGVFPRKMSSLSKIQFCRKLLSNELDNVVSLIAGKDSGFGKSNRILSKHY